jgi:hypothetical protein
MKKGKEKKKRVKEIKKERFMAENVYFSRIKNSLAVLKKS